jgi:formaldehyde-activating enzyme involved in methanogenesis
VTEEVEEVVVEEEEVEEVVVVVEVRCHFALQLAHSLFEGVPEHLRSLNLRIGTMEL